MSVFRDRQIVPVLMFHSVGPRLESWVWSGMTERIAVFERTLAGLAGKGFRTVGLDELYRHMSGERPLAGDAVVLTFDDGYLDNWVHVAPLLRKYGMKGVVYVSPEFVQPDGPARRTVEDAWSGDIDPGSLECHGFMNWSELRALDAEGVLDVQSHALTHTWYFDAPEVVDFHRPRDVDPYPWMAWNERPDRKPYYLAEDQQSLLPWGRPVFSHEKSLITKRFFPDEGVIAEIEGYVSANGGAEFFDREDWAGALERKFACLGEGQRFPGSFESDADYRRRVLHELTSSRQILAEALGKTVDYLSWPGGGVNETAAALATEAGYRSWTMSSWQRPADRNRPGTDPGGIKRISGRSKVHWRRQLISDGDAWWIIQRVLTHQGSLASNVMVRLRKILWRLLKRPAGNH